MNRRRFLSLAAPAAAMTALPARGRVEDDLRITGVRLVRMRRQRPVPSYEPAPGSWSASGVEFVNPVSVYPKYKPMRSLYLADGPRAKSFWVEVSTNKGVRGYGPGGPGGGVFVEDHLARLVTGENPLDIERLWDIMWRATMYYGRKSVVVNAISAVDIALWDIAGKVWDAPVWRLLGGRIRQRIPCYCPGNDIEQHVEFGFKRLKLALPHGPVDGREGIRKNVELVKRARSAVGPDGDVMMDCGMGLTERYTLELCEAFEPYNVYWIEEALPPDDFEGLGRLRRQITSTRIVTGEHVFTRYGFRELLRVNGAEIWQPDIRWCGGMSELVKIGHMAAAHDIPVIPHIGGQRDGVHFIYATPNAPWAELFMPAPGGPEVVYERFEEDHNLTRGPEGIYTRPSDGPGFGWEFEPEE